MHTFAVIGKDVSKSVSPQIHKFIAGKMKKDITYLALSVKEEEFENEIESILKTYDGVNVTIPYKLSIIPHLSKIEGDARTYGAVNTVLTSTKVGYNTDGLGFELMLKNGGVEVDGKTFLLLGAGGAGRSVCKKLVDGGATVFVYDKFEKNVEALVSEFGVTGLKAVEDKAYYGIINATGIGMHKTEGISPVGEGLIKLCEVAIDLIYTPPKSKFLEIAESLGKPILNGLSMLFYQAYFADCIYFDRQPCFDEAKEFYKEFLSEGII